MSLEEVAHLSPPQEKISQSNSKAISVPAIVKLPVIDLNLAAKILDTDAESAREMIADLVRMLPRDLQDLKSAFDEKNNQKLKDKAHYIKGGASYCGTLRLKLAAAELEDCIKVGSDSACVKNTYQNLCDEIELLLQEYSKMSK